MARQFGSLEPPSFGTLEPSFSGMSIAGDTAADDTPTTQITQFAKKVRIDDFNF